VVAATEMDQKLFGMTYSRNGHPNENLQARITSILRRQHSRHDVQVCVADIVIASARRKVTVGDREVHLARKEFTLLRVRASDPSRVFAKDELLRDVWALGPARDADH
jgi:DNA-binding response OmpR family regulator